MILLSFDIEEFDMPLEYNGKISFEEQIAISRSGLQAILALLKKHSAKATFFSTVVFAEHNQDLIKELLGDGHELASHTWYHSQFEIADLQKSKQRLEELFSVEISGLRMPRMMQVDPSAVANAGYSYNSSINPTYLPGRYNHLKVSRTYYKEENILQIPASVSPTFRIPLFWLSFHNFPTSLYKKITTDVIKKDGYLNIYFHPWEFADIKNPEFKLPGYTTRNTGKAMTDRFDVFLQWLTNRGNTFGTFREFIIKKHL